MSWKAEPDKRKCEKVGVVGRGCGIKVNKSLYCTHPADWRRKKSWLSLQAFQLKVFPHVVYSHDSLNLSFKFLFLFFFLRSSSRRHHVSILCGPFQTRFHFCRIIWNSFADKNCWSIAGEFSFNLMPFSLPFFCV